MAEPRAYYNEFDPKAAEWLRELIKAGHIAPGEVDERDIRDVTPNDLVGFHQAHFFAGIGVWSYALRKAGWPDGRKVWTGSCPCQPFSAAGKGGGFDDERHLWPAWHWLIEQCRPERIFGEQVASRDGLAWLDLVSSDLEGSQYACGAVNLPACGVGAPHIRQRLWFMADAMPAGWAEGWAESRNGSAAGRCGAGELALSDSERFDRIDPLLQPRRQDETSAEIARCGTSRELVNAGRARGWRDAGAVPRAQGARSEQRLEDGREPYESGLASSTDIMGNPYRQGRQGERGDDGAEREAVERTSGATRGFWANAEWIYCRDGKYRPVEPGTFPLAHGAPARVGRLRGYGNAINSEAAAAFIGASMSQDSRRSKVP